MIKKENSNHLTPIYSGKDTNRNKKNIAAVAEGSDRGKIEVKIMEPKRTEASADRKSAKKAENPRKSHDFKALWSLLTNRRVTIVLGSLLVLLGIYACISCVFFLSKGYADQNLIEAYSILENTKSHQIANNAGPVGASLGNLLINRSFGIGSFFLIYWIIAIGLRLLIPKLRINLCSVTFICIVSTLVVSSLLGLVAIWSNYKILPGGYFGLYANAFLISATGKIGAVLVNVFLIALLAVLFLDTLRKIFRFLSPYASRILRSLPMLQFKKKEKPAETEPSPTISKAQESPARTHIIYFDRQPDDSDKAAANDTPTTDNSKSESTDSVDLCNKDNPAESIPEANEKPANEGPDAKAGNDSSATENKNGQNTSAEMPVDADGKSTVLSIPSDDAVDMTITAGSIERADEVVRKPYNPTEELSRYKFPPASLLADIPEQKISIDIAEQEENKAQITQTLANFDIAIKSIQVCVGPTVTLYEIIPAEGVRIARIRNLENDIALRLAALGIRIIAPIPGKGTIGIEVPNKEKQIVPMRHIIESRQFQECKYELPIALGCTISNDVFIADLTKMPHILVAGATGMGKSVGLNAIVTSLLYKKHPSQLKFVMIDPKMVEFSMYAPLERHYMAEVAGEDCIITDMKKAVSTLYSLVQEMEDRLVLLRDAGVRNIQEYNKKFTERRLNPEKGHRYLPYIVVIIDELADLIMNIGRKEVETPISRITQKARAVGIHMILATQRPSTDIITGVIKANCPGRIAFRVAQMTDSRIILDCSGAQQLIGRGDMLIAYNNMLTRVQCALVETDEVAKIAEYISRQPGYESAYILPEPENENENNSDNGSSSQLSASRSSLAHDPQFAEAARFIVANGSTASTTSLQRHFHIGYPRAGAFIDQMQTLGIVGPSLGARPRKVLVDNDQLEDILRNLQNS